MKSITALTSATLLGACLSLPSQAQIDIEIDPATYVFKGDSLHVKLTTTNAPQWRWGLGTYSLELPSALVETNQQNKPGNWTVDIHRAYGLFTEYYLNPEQTGWFIGGQVSEQTFRVINPTQAASEFTNGLLMVNLGYKWAIADSAFYLLPWAGLGYTQTTGNNPSRLAAGFDVDPFTAFMSVHIGYEF